MNKKMVELNNAINDVDAIVAAYCNSCETSKTAKKQAERWLKVSGLLRELKAYRETGCTPEQIRKRQAENDKLKQQMQEDEE